MLRAGRMLVAAILLLVPALSTTGAAADAADPFAAIVPTRTGSGYWLVDRAGGFTAVESVSA